MSTRTTEAPAPQSAQAPIWPIDEAAIVDCLRRELGSDAEAQAALQDIRNGVIYGTRDGRMFRFAGGRYRVDYPHLVSDLITLMLGMAVRRAPAVR